MLSTKLTVLMDAWIPSILKSYAEEQLHWSGELLIWPFIF